MESNIKETVIKLGVIDSTGTRIKAIYESKIYQIESPPECFYEGQPFWFKGHEIPPSTVVAVALNCKLQLHVPARITGDIFQIAIFMMLHKHAILTLQEVSSKYTHKLSYILAFLMRFGLEERVFINYHPDSVLSQPHKKMPSLKERYSKTNPYLSFTNMTAILAHTFTHHFQCHLKIRWSHMSASSHQAIIQLWLNTKAPLWSSLPKRQVIIIWSRLSGQRGGAHPELDSNHKGTLQLCALARKFDCNVIICGDDNGLPLPRYALDLRGFWQKRDYPKVREAQFQPFLSLEALGYHLLHIGMRSGNLEAFAYLGQQVLYIDPKGSIGEQRMSHLSHNPDICYQRIAVDAPPSPIGKIIIKRLQRLRASSKAGFIKTGGLYKDITHKKRQAHSCGFTSKDLSLIKDHMGKSLTSMPKAPLQECQLTLFHKPRCIKKASSKEHTSQDRLKFKAAHPGS